MVLNNCPQMFSIYFPSNFFYEEVIEKWSPIVEKMRLPYRTVDDFMNAQIQSVTFPGASIENSVQQRRQYDIMYPGGKELEVLLNKELNITFKLTESYLSYWIIWDQMDRYLHYVNEGKQLEPVWMEPVHLIFLNDAGFGMTQFCFRDIVPTSLGELNLSYAAQAASYNTFNWSLRFNRFDTDAGITEFKDTKRIQL